HILDGNHRLVGKGCEQLDLLVSERRDLRLPQTYCAERHALAQQGYCQHCPGTRQLLGFREIIFPVCPAVWNLHYTALEQRATCRSSPPCADWGALPQLQGTGRGIVGSGGTAAFAIVAENHAVLGTANADGILQQRPEDTLEVERRSADGLEHLGPGSLLPQRFAQLLCARLHVVEQPHILNCDHRLVGKCGHQLDLPVSEGLDLRFPQRDDAERETLAQQWDGQHRPHAHFPQRLVHFVFGVGLDIDDLDGAALKQGSAGRLSSLCADRCSFPHLNELGGNVVTGRGATTVPVIAKNLAMRGTACAGGSLKQRLQHALEIERGAADHFEHVGGGGLLLQRFAQLVKQAGVLDRDHSLFGKGG